MEKSTNKLEMEKIENKNGKKWTKILKHNEMDCSKNQGTVYIHI
jgi:hypothetical protein